jgi:hypothetical protein
MLDPGSKRGKQSGGSPWRWPGNPGRRTTGPARTEPPARANVPPFPWNGTAGTPMVPQMVEQLLATIPQLQE